MAGASPDRHIDAMSSSIKKGNHRRNVKGSENPLDFNSQQDATFVRKSVSKAKPINDVDVLIHSVSFFCYLFILLKVI
jgi:hypothetical protein